MRSSPLLVFAFVALLLVGLGVASFVFLMPSTAPSSAGPGDTAASAPVVDPTAPTPAVADAGLNPKPTKAAEAAPTTALAEGGAAAPRPDDAGREEVKVAEADVKGFAKGRVLDFNGTPALGAKVYIVGKSGSVSMMGPDAETDAKGEFFVSINVKKKKTQKLRVTRKDRLPINVDNIVFRPKETFDAGTLQFAPCGSLDVAVTDTDGRPIPNVHVVLDSEKGEKTLDGEPKDDADSDPGRTAKESEKWRNEGLQMFGELARTRRMTDESGVARFPALAVGKVTVKAEAPSADFASAFGGGSGRRGNVKVGVNVGGARREVSEEGVKGDRGDAGRDAPKAEALSDSELKKVDIVMGAQNRVDLTLAGLAILTGRATIHGAPLANEFIGMHSTQTAGSFLGKMGMTVRAKTDGDGKFTFPPAPPGNYVVKKGDPGTPVNIMELGSGEGIEAFTALAAELMKPADSPDRDLGRQVEVKRGINKFDIDFGGAALEVFVQDLDSGVAISDATIRLFDHSKDDEKVKRGGIDRIASAMVATEGKRPVRLRVKSDGRGRAEFKELQGGSYRIIARADGRPPSLNCDFEVVEGHHSRVVVKVPRGTAISGTVSDRNGNALKATVNVIFDRDMEPAFPDEILSMLSSSGPSILTDAKGAFRLEGLEAGRHLLLATAEGFAPTALRVDAPSEGNLFFLEKPGTIRVTVVRDGKPEKGAMVSLDTRAEDAPIPDAAWSSFAMMQQMFSSRMTNTDEQGIAVLKNVPVGEWNVMVSDFSSPAKSAEETSKDLDDIRVVSKVVTEQAKDPAESVGQAKAARSIQDRLESLFTHKKARVRVYAEQESTARLELGK